LLIAPSILAIVILVTCHIYIVADATTNHEKANQHVIFAEPVTNRSGKYLAFFCAALKTMLQVIKSQKLRKKSSPVKFSDMFTFSFPLNSLASTGRIPKTSNVVQAGTTRFVTNSIKMIVWELFQFASKNNNESYTFTI
jgi:hexokinase